MLDMGMIKVEINFSELKQAVSEFRQKRRKAFEVLVSEIRDATGRALNPLMSAEMATR